MGKELRIFEDFQREANHELTDKEFKVYLAMMRRVFFKPKTNIPQDGSEIVKYSRAIAKLDGIKISNTGFKNVIDNLIRKNYMVIFKKGEFSGKHIATEYRLKRF